MALRTGKLILAKNILLDKSYKNVIDYSESQMVNLVTSKKVAEFSDCSFIRQGGNEIDIEISYGQSLQCNYLAFQNPDYSNKWFFAFIDEVQYISEKTTRFTFTIDVFSTWKDYWNYKQCFVVREHTNDDTIGANLVPENFELGEYVASNKRNVGFTGKRYVIISIYNPKGGSTKTLYTNVNGVPISGGVWVFDSPAAMQNAVLQYSNDARLDQITQVYMVPYTIFDDNDLTADTLPNVSDPDAGLFYQFKGKSSAVSREVTLSRPANLNGYVPKNNKLFTSPYMFITTVNHNGTTSSYGYEYFSNPAAPVFKAKGAASVGTSIEVYPVNYKGVEDNYNEGIMCGKFPTLSWSGDSYTNWLTQNAVNIGTGVINDIVSIGAFASGASVNGTGLINNIAGELSEFYQRKIAPITSTGNTNGGDVLSGEGVNSCYAIQMSIQSQFAKRIDDFWTMFGYKTNLLKIPNETGRPHWNFIQIADGDDIGHSDGSISVPPNDMEAINNIYRTGVTIWHNHDEIGNYALDNRLGQ